MADITFTQLHQEVSDLAKTITRASGAIHARAQQLSDEAQDTSRLAEGIAVMRVDKTTIGETRELAKIMEGLSEQAIAYASAGTTTARMATAAGDQANASHGAFYEAATRSIIGTDVYDIDREWFRQE
ncbi:hypothetical protein [Streptomyces sp. SID161]|uniref:hypothetical protein n=1 Tax=Streptomyces sp. SID161 TaxID=2690251 RepID=UPI001368C054|nr:hypothetical protein [Streptomyces sp. SID161]MYW43068.1 hypothetical protein [Streptomyces sp. SID161]